MSNFSSSAHNSAAASITAEGNYFHSTLWPETFKYVGLQQIFTVEKQQLPANGNPGLDVTKCEKDLMKMDGW